jgi:hypothetical protein
MDNTPEHGDPPDPTRRRHHALALSQGEARHHRFLGDRHLSQLALPIAVFVTIIAWVPLYLQRGYSHSPNVDDYLYASVAMRIGNAFRLGVGTGFRAFLHTGSNAPLVPTAAAPLATLGGIQGAVGVELVILLLLVFGSYLLSRVWLTPTTSALIAIAATLNEAVIGWSLMLNFALAATTATVWCFAGYLHSRRLQDWRWTIVFGVAAGALLLTRSLSIVYAISLAICLLADLAWHHRRHVWTTLPWAQIVVSLLTVAVIAGPWWLISGPAALRYLHDDGYSASGGFAGHGGIQLSPGAIFSRASDTLRDLGYVQSAVLTCALVFAVIFGVRRRRPGTLLVATWIVITFGLLSTSANSGTGFGLPLLIVSAVLAGTVLPPDRVVGVVLVVVLVIGLLAEATGGVSQWWLGPPYRQDALLATGGTKIPNLEALTQRVLASVSSGKTLITRDDDVLNANGLIWFADRQHISGFTLAVTPYGPTKESQIRSELTQVRFLITGTTMAPYHDFLDQHTVQTTAYRLGFRRLHIWSVSPHNTIEVWVRR